MTQWNDYRIHCTPFLFQLFAEHGSPNIHMFTNANDRLVFEYSQASNDQTAYAEGKTAEPQSRLRWSYDTVLITRTDGWTATNARDIMSRMHIDQCRVLYILIKNNRQSMNDVFRRYSKMSPIMCRPIGWADVAFDDLPIIYIVSNNDSWNLNLIPRVLEAKDLIDVRMMLKRSNKSTSRTCIVDPDSLHNVPSSEWKGYHEWWKSILENPNNALIHSNDNSKYLRPAWMKRFYYDPAELPAIEDLRYPCVARAEREVPLPDPPNDEFSRHVWQTSIAPSPEIFRISTQINTMEFERSLRSFPNQSYSLSWLKALKEGLWPWADNFENDPEAGKVYPNSPTITSKKRFIMGVLRKELGFNHWRGPLATKPMYFRNAVLSAVPKSEGGDRLIQNQSHPKGLSVNDHIPVECGKVVYDNMSDLANVIRIFHKQGRKNMVPWKLDVSRAFRHIPLHPLFSLRNGVVIKTRSGADQIYIDSQACFGGRTFPRAYCALDDLWCWVAVKQFKVQVLFHFVDDHYGISEVEGPNEEPKDMKKLRKAFELMNVPTNEKHDFGDGIVVTGTEISYSDATFQLSEAKLIRYLSTCRSFIPKSKMRVDELEHVCGILEHCIDIVPYGKTWQTSFYAAKSGTQSLAKCTLISITKGMKESLQWWVAILASAPTRYLLKEVWWNANDADEIIWVDASSSSGLGIYRHAKEIGYIHCYDENGLIFKGLQKERKGAIVHINTVELLVVLCAVQIVRSELSTNNDSPFRLLIMSDNQATCDVVATRTSSDHIMSALLKDISEALSTLIDLRVCHVCTECNPADYLSRGMTQVSKMRSNFRLNSLHHFIPISIDSYIEEANQKADEKLKKK